MKVLPWLLAGAFAISTVILGLRSPGSAAPRPTPAAAPAPAAATAPAPDLALRRCSVKLELTAAQLANARSSAAPACDAGVEAEIARRLEEATAARLSERDIERAAIRSMVEDFLAITPEQSAWLMDYVCAVRGMRADVLDEIKAHQLDLEEAARRQMSERQDALDDLKKMLGDDRYQKLRSVGGLGKLGDLFAC